jgi:hypothetical protein
MNLIQQHTKVCISFVNAKEVKIITNCKKTCNQERPINETPQNRQTQILEIDNIKITNKNKL